MNLRLLPYAICNSDLSTYLEDDTFKRMKLKGNMTVARLCYMYFVKQKLLPISVQTDCSLSTCKILPVLAKTNYLFLK